MGEVMANAASGMSASGTQAAVDVKLLKQVQDMAQSQTAQLLNSIPQSASLPGVGGGIDVTA